MLQDVHGPLLGQSVRRAVRHLHVECHNGGASGGRHVDVKGCDWAHANLHHFYSHCLARQRLHRVPDCLCRPLRVRTAAAPYEMLKGQCENDCILLIVSPD